MRKFYKNLWWGRFSLQKVRVTALVLFGMMQSVDAQVNSYAFTQNTGVFSSIASSGTLVAGSDATTSATNDTAGWSVAIPFTFKFNGIDYTSIYVNSNGGATFGSTTSNSSTVISTTSAYDGAIGVMNRDLWGAFVTSGVTTSGSDIITNVGSFYGIEIGKQLNNVNGIPSGATVTAFDTSAGTITMSAPATSSSSSAVIRYGTGKVITSTEGVAPNRVFVIEWIGYNDYSTAVTGSNYLNFQLRLSETTNTISVVYGPQYNINTTSRTNQIGLRGTSNSDFNNRTGIAGNPWDSTSAGTTNSATVSRDNTNFPAPGLTFTWTPPTCLSPSSVSSSNITTNAATISWTAPAVAPANGYEYYYSTSNTAPTMSTVPSGASTTLSAPLSGLSPATTYYVWVRSVCSASDTSGWSVSGTFVTLCAPVTSVSENFDSYGTGSIVPNCWYRMTGTGSQTITSTTPASGTRNIYQYATSTQTPVIVALPELSNINAGTHWLRFKARVSSGAPGSLDVGYVTDINNPATFVVIQTLSITNTSYTVPEAEYKVTVPNTVPANARLAIRNATDSKSYYWDNVYWEVAPTCFAPTAVTASNVTANTATISWTAPATAPANGYEYYYSTSNTTPTMSTTPSGVSTTLSAPLSGLSPITTYYVWVRSVCSTSDKSDWSALAATFQTLCQPPAILSTSGATVCGASGSATISATADSGAIITWYDAATGGATLATGSSYTTPVISSTTTYYVSAKSDGGINTVGPANPSILGSISDSNYAINTYYQIFDVTVPTTLISIDVFPVSSVAIGTNSAIEIRDSSGATLVSVPYTVAVNDGVTPQTVTLNYPLPVGIGYRIGQGQGSGINLNRNTAGATYPYTSSAINVTGNNFSSGPNYWYYIYNWKFSSSCESARQPVTVTVDSACLGTNEIENQKNNIKVYPNPFVDTLTISDISNVKSVSIMDVAGRLVKTIDTPSSALHLGELKSGLYLVVLTMKDGSRQTIKAIKK
ncbi:fibronectin type III domain-containing protein [Chryseobacterium daecheongense]|uniref:fibronectin type III domain-containing protein n=1 Tax=Chryseobacterium daecheongense TaxID=192389 RepID=UPI001FD6906B|nr:fibronectin type III domain-containing protein [Chryseobacterium daecheongense]UOU98096.1 fibronectin type III domain-containing protein [Chryseobacterium daecheongense]